MACVISFGLQFTVMASFGRSVRMLDYMDVVFGRFLVFLKISSHDFVIGTILYRTDRSVESGKPPSHTSSKTWYRMK